MGNQIAANCITDCCQLKNNTDLSHGTQSTIKSFSKHQFMADLCSMDSTRSSRRGDFNPSKNAICLSISLRNLPFATCYGAPSTYCVIFE